MGASPHTNSSDPSRDSNQHIQTALGTNDVQQLAQIT